MISQFSLLGEYIMNVFISLVIPCGNWLLFIKTWLSLSLSFFFFFFCLFFSRIQTQMIYPWRLCESLLKVVNLFRCPPFEDSLFWLALETGLLGVAEGSMLYGSSRELIQHFELLKSGYFPWIPSWKAHESYIFERQRVHLLIHFFTFLKG